MRKHQAGRSQFKTGYEWVEGDNLRRQKAGPSLGGGVRTTRESGTLVSGCCWPGWGCDRHFAI